MKNASDLYLHMQVQPMQEQKCCIKYSGRAEPGRVSVLLNHPPAMAAMAVTTAMTAQRWHIVLAVHGGYQPAVYELTSPVVNSPSPAKTAGLLSTRLCPAVCREDPGNRRVERWKRKKPGPYLRENFRPGRINSAAIHTSGGVVATDGRGRGPASRVRHPQAGAVSRVGPDGSPTWPRSC